MLLDASAAWTFGNPVIDLERNVVMGLEALSVFDQQVFSDQWSHAFRAGIWATVQWCFVRVW